MYAHARPLHAPRTLTRPQLIGQSNFVSTNDGDLYISTSPAGPTGVLDAAALQNVLASFGDLRAFGAADTHARVRPRAVPAPAPR